MKIGIRREDKNQWEARVPLIPEHIRELSNTYDVTFYVQPSPIRIFKDSEYKSAGALISEDLSACDIVLAVKEIPLSFFRKNGVYLFFAHIIKGQAYNMPMLQRMLDRKTTLIDYEKITNNKGQRLVFFGRFAGIAGMIDSFWALGQRLLAEGYETPFLMAKQAYRYSNLNAAKQAFLEIAARLKKTGLPKKLAPLVFGFAGYGHVSNGAQEIFNLFPHIDVPAEELPKIASQNIISTRHLYKVVFKEQHLVKPVRPDRKFKLHDYYQHPERYESRFPHFLPHLDVLINAIYWDFRYPRLITKKYLRQNYQSGAPLRLRVIGDITCDREGSIECNLKTSDTGNPVYVYNPLTQEIKDGVIGEGPVILAVDNLPCELPVDSSVVFSNVLKEFIPSLLKVDFTQSFDKANLAPSIKRATIIYQGELTADFRYLQQYLDLQNH